MKKKILIADDHPAIRLGVKQILSGHLSGCEFGEATQAADIVRKASEEKWDLIILDIDLPGRNGFEILNDLKSRDIKIPVLIFSIYSEDQVAVRALKSGAFGFLSKGADDKDLVSAVNQILDGHRYVSASVTDLLISHVENPERVAPHQLLSDREYQTMLLIASGKTITQIAKEFSLSTSTINTYRSRILEKMGLNGNAEIMSYVIRNKLIPLT